MTQAGKWLARVGLLGAAVAPPVVAWWQHVGAQHPVLATLLLLGYETALAAVVFLGQIAGNLRARWRERIVDRLDQALRRRMSRFDRRYRESVLAALRFVDLKGLSTVGFYTPELAEVFVDLTFVPRAAHEIPADLLAGDDADPARRRSIWEFLGQRKPTVLAVVGVPGSGKTTLLRHTARRLCVDRARRRRPLPILLYLRDHVTEILADNTIGLTELVRNALIRDPADEPAGWFESHLDNGDCVVLLDGLDEVASQDDRRAVADWVERQVRRYPRNDFVITSRPHGYRSARIDGATVLQVCAFTPEQVVRFVHAWYRAVEQHDGGSEDARARATDAANGLLDRLRESPVLYDLTANPLLLTMIVNVHRDRHELPGSRAELYQEICQAVLWRRHEAKSLATALGGEVKQALLGGLAFTMMSRRVRDFDRAAVLAAVRPALRRVSRELTAEGFLADVGSNGLLIERENDLYSFSHHTIQEYLAATHIQAKGLVGALSTAVDDPWWRETTLVHAACSTADPIILACLESRTVAALTLAFECAEQRTVDIADDVRAKLDRLLESAFDLDADPELRHLMSRVIVSRHLSLSMPVGETTRLCARPISTAVYRLFLQATDQSADARALDGERPPAPGTTEPVTGVWAQDAVAFTRWVNGISGDDRVYRLPTRSELDDSGARDALATAARGATAPLSAWIQPGHDSASPQLWTPVSSLRPHWIDMAVVAEQVAGDVSTEGSVAFRLLLLRSIVALRALTLDRPRQGDLDLGDALDADRTGVLLKAFDLAVRHAKSVRLDRLRERDRDLDRVIQLADTLHTEHTSLFDLANALNHAMRNALGHALDPALDRALGRTLSRALSRALDSGDQSRFESVLAQALVGVSDPARVGFVARLASMTDYLHQARTDLFDRYLRLNSVPPPWVVRVADRLADTAVPIFLRQVPITADSAAGIRLAALCLAAESEAQAGGLGNVFRSFAADVTLLERRATGRAPTPETIILAVG
ncbi:NACHT domain-containing protein [Solihabitans fulvus]|uniref:NACHT domain-containing protein n=1 Tax=Solihabitans fulvus TaxID=1892852 RepID=A0A5B2XIG5_9PSEU|nr:NACHT domain-containing protein [Solihabitans fulvus]KAA2262721.1 NACHT domain-containing protein [Solihabitans fulvus]